MSLMDHIRHLAETIPRGSTRPEERRAAEYAEKVLRAAGLEPVSMVACLLRLFSRA